MRVVRSACSRVQEEASRPEKDADTSRYHLENPYWKTFDPYVKPLLEGDIHLTRNNELDTSKEVRVEQDSELWEAVKKHQS